MIPAVRHLLIRSTPSCREVTQWASRSLERPLSLRRRIRLRPHVLICVWCERYVRQLRLMRVVLRRYAKTRAGSPSSSETSLSPDVRERMTRALQRNAP